MILERLAVEGFRRIAAPYELVPDERLTIVSGPNGTGKSTLLDALYHGLLEKHTITGALANERFAARGRDLVPRVCIDFRIEAIRYRLRKHFLGGKLSQLERWECGAYRRYKEGAASDDFVRELFAAEAPGRGAVDLGRHGGLAHILWSPAGARYGAVPAGAGDAVRAMLGAGTVAGIGERAVENRIAERFAHYFTESGAPARSHGSANLPAGEAAMTQATADVAAARTAVEHIDELRRSYENSLWEEQRLAARRTALRAQRDATKSAATAYDKLVRQRDECARAQTSWRERCDALQRRIVAIAELRERRTAVDRQRAALQVRGDALGTGLDAAATELALAVREAAAAATARAEIAARAADVTAAEAYAAANGERAARRGRLDAVEAALREIAKLQASRTRLLAPERAELARLRRDDSDRRSLDAAINAAALTVEITVDVPACADVLVGDRPGSHRLQAGTAATFSAADHIVVAIPGFGRIVARGVDSATDVRSKHGELVARIGETLARLSAASIFELEDRFERAAVLDHDIAAMQRALEERLAGDDLATVRSQSTEIETRIAALVAAHPQWAGAAPDAARLRRAFDADLQQSTEAERTARDRRESAQRAFDAVRADLAALAEDRHDCDVNEERAVARLADLAADADTDDERDRDMHTALLEWKAAAAQHTDIDVRLGAFDENPHTVQARLEVEERAVGANYEQCHGQTQRDLALLEDHVRRGRYRQLAEAEERLEALAIRQRAETTEAAATKLLRDTLERVRRERTEAVLEPVARGATQYLARIAGPALGPVRMELDLTPAGVHHAASDRLFGLESTLSAGEREQIYIATRFALADVIAGHRGRQLFVLDDILTATDPGRLRRFIGLLEELSRERLQIIVTTADPSRYLGIAGAVHVDLRAALSLADAA